MSNIYAVYCKTKKRVVYATGDNPPSICPNNQYHVIDPNTIKQVNGIVGMQLEEGKDYTGQNVKWRGFNFEPADIEPGQTSTKLITFPYNITIMKWILVTSDEQEDDVIQAYINKNAEIGRTEQIISIGTNIIPVPSTTVTKLKVGYKIVLDDGINFDNLGEVIAINGNNITTQNNTSFAFSLNTAIRLQVHIAEDFILGPGQKYEIGDSVNNARIPANYAYTIEYTNNHNTTIRPKFYLEYFY